VANPDEKEGEHIMAACMKASGFARKIKKAKASKS
jgi:hypothetical protein